jgi:alpha-2-macroglobulin
VRTIARRQNPDGGIGYWRGTDWSTPWLTSYAARVLLEARAAGVDVDSTMLARIADYLTRSLHQDSKGFFAVTYWHEHRSLLLAERVAAVDMLSRLGRPDVPAENSLMSEGAQLLWDDRLVLAEVLQRRGATSAAKLLLTSAWRAVTPAGRALNVPTPERRHYFASTARPTARLLTATLAIEPEHPQLGALVETLVQQGRAVAADVWNTQDYGAIVLALGAYERQRARSTPGTIRIDGPRGTILTRNLAAGETRDTTFTLDGLVKDNTVRLRVTAQSTSPIYYYLTIREVPRARPVRPVDRGIQVERWYERIDTREAVMRVAAGELVRVRLRITVPADRHFVVLDDPLPAGLEAVDLSLRTVRPPGVELPEARDPAQPQDEFGWYYGSWDAGVWSVFDHKELRDDRVIYSSTYLWKGTHTATYLARATTIGTFVMPPAHAEEMYNPAVNGRTGGGEFTVTVTGTVPGR